MHISYNICDVCGAKIENAPTIKMNTKYEYSAPKARDDNRMFVSVSGSYVGYGGYGYNESQAHEIEMCVRCARYLEGAMKYLKDQIAGRDLKETDVPAGFPPVTIT